MNERERIELLMKCYDLSPSQFADKTGIQRASVSHIISGRNKPSLEVMLKIYEAFPSIDMKWLMMGAGEAPTRQAAMEGAASVAPDTLFAGQNSATQADTPLFAAHQEPLQQAMEEPRSRRPVVPQPVEEPKPNRTPLQQSMRERAIPDVRPRRTPAARSAQVAAMQADKKIKEIRIYYTDGTYETLVPEK